MKLIRQLRLWSLCLKRIWIYKLAGSNIVIDDSNNNTFCKYLVDL